jgi:hypothetical protein
LTVTVVSAFKVIVQVTVEDVVHPLHETELLLPEAAGAVNVTDVPAL